MVACAYLPWAWISRTDNHIVAGVFEQHRHRRASALWLEICVKLFMLLYVAVFTYQTFMRAVQQTRAGEVWEAAGGFIPVWPSRWMLPSRPALMALYLVLRVWRGHRSRGFDRGRAGVGEMSTLTISLTSLGLHPGADRAAGADRRRDGLRSRSPGFWYLRNFNVALSVLRDTPFVFAASWDLSAIPMFLLMGAIAGNSGIGTALFRAAVAWFGGMPGGLAVATNWACAGFGAASRIEHRRRRRDGAARHPGNAEAQIRQGPRDRRLRQRRHARCADPAEHPVRDLRHFRRGLDRQAAARRHPSRAC